MSPHAVNNFVSDLVLMAQAMERLPQVEARVKDLEGECDAWMHKHESLEGDLAQAKAYSATLEQKVHDLEVAKDAAETMFLEADDRTSRALDFIKATFGNAGSLIQALEPPKAVEPQPVPEGLHSEPTHSEGNEVAVHAEPQVGEVKPIYCDDPKGFLSTADGSPEPRPFVDGTESQSTSAPSTVVNEVSASQPSWASPTPPDTKPQPYAGKRYIDVEGLVSYDNWVANGGTYDGYWAGRY